jgi:SAM-dependent MidA family methyltransferase
MEEADSDRGQGLKTAILSVIKEKGPIPFVRFMERCLYHPQYGYYQAGRARIGKEGDFYTSPSVHPLFGRLLARQLLQMSEILGGNLFDVVEFGGGKGFLCQDILDWSKQNAPSFYHRIKYSLLETSPCFREEQAGRLAGEIARGKVSWIDPERFKEERNWIVGCILSNEVLDAFPVHRVSVQQGSLRELYVAEDDGEFAEQWGELSDPRLASYFDSLPFSLAEGQKAEVNLLSLEWMQGAARNLRRGFVLTIDYGYPAHDLYSPHRSEGTLLCYRRHRVSENPYDTPGEQDITSHVDFSRLIEAGEQEGLRLTGLVPQYRFLFGLGLVTELESLAGSTSEPEALRARLSIKHLIEPETGMGEVFKVLVQHKGIEKPDLDGLRQIGPGPGI